MVNIMQRLFLAFVLTASITVPGIATAAGYDAVITKPVTEVRGGQSTVYPVTGMLRQGSRVHVVREEGNWVAITPPDGSSSWVMGRVLNPEPTMGMRNPPATVLADNTDIMLGSSDRPGPHTTRMNTVNQGTMVVVLGEKTTSDVGGDKTTWWRIQPTANEVRWITKDSITTMNGTIAGNKQMPESWVRAEQAERAGNLQQAIELYRQVSTEQSKANGDSELATRAYNRAEALTRRVTQPAATFTSRQSPTSSDASPVAPTPQVPAGVTMTTGPGLLRRSAVFINNQNAYVLEDSRGVARVYVIPQPGLNLEPFVNRRVEMFGPMTNRGDLPSNGFITVTKLHILQKY
jgi:uncharacterized protein YgiM (DUF1202 family)